MWAAIGITFLCGLGGGLFLTMSVVGAAIVTRKLRRAEAWESHLKSVGKAGPQRWMLQ